MAKKVTKLKTDIKTISKIKSKVDKKLPNEVKEEVKVITPETINGMSIELYNAINNSGLNTLFNI